MRWSFVLVTCAVLGACGQDAQVGDANGSDIDAPITVHPPDEFPLHVAADGGSLVSQNGMPFLLHGEAAWSLIAQPTSNQMEQYLADRDSRGVRAILVNLVEHKFADNPPANAAGAAPFTTPNDFSTPNEAYFAHADEVIDHAAAHGIAVMLFPAYLGYQGGDEGWFAAMSALSQTKCRQYGDFVGARYANRINIIWMWGGDYTPPSGSAGEICMKAIADGIRAAEPTALASAHWDPESTSRAEGTFSSIIDLVGVYTYSNDLQQCRDARAVTPSKPAFLLETTYENEHSAPVFQVRQQQWWAMIGCGAGEISGNLPIWNFSAGWPQQLGSPLSKAQAHLAAITTSIPWQDLERLDALVTAGRGSGDAEVAAARTADSKYALVYIPPAGAATITVDLSKMSGPANATWYDPTTGASTSAGTGLTGSKALATPGDNAAGDGDWVLVLTSP
jgi:hypothetical protein